MVIKVEKRKKGLTLLGDRINWIFLERGSPIRSRGRLT